jgi:CRISPR-associated exonuclease Cas4
VGELYREDDYLQLSGIQRFTFCRRQWALVHIEGAWEENVLTMEGKLMHERAHDPFFTEKRGNVIISRDMPICSREMGVSGACDVVEFTQDADGVRLFGREGAWMPKPVEYKRGSPKISDTDRLQLCAQAMCLEEMLSCRAIDEAHIYYGQTRRRERVPLTEELRASVHRTFEEMHGYYARKYTPRVKPSKSCNACSLKDVCLPQMPGASGSVRSYLESSLEDNVI